MKASKAPYKFKKLCGYTVANPTDQLTITYLYNINLWIFPMQVVNDNIEMEMGNVNFVVRQFWRN